MRPETALLRALSGPPLSLVEQNFDFDLLTPQKLLEKSVGQKIRVFRTNPVTGADSSEAATASTRSVPSESNDASRHCCFLPKVSSMAASAAW